MKFTNSNINGVTNETEILDDSTLDQVLEEFQNFLRGSGYVIEYDKCLVLTDMDKGASFDELYGGDDANPSEGFGDN